MVSLTSINATLVQEFEGNLLNSFCNNHHFERKLKYNLYNIIWDKVYDSLFDSLYTSMHDSLYAVFDGDDDLTVSHPTRFS